MKIHHSLVALLLVLAGAANEVQAHNMRLLLSDAAGSSSGAVAEAVADGEEAASLAIESSAVSNIDSTDDGHVESDSTSHSMVAVADAAEAEIGVSSDSEAGHTGAVGGGGVTSHAAADGDDFADAKTAARARVVGDVTDDAAFGAGSFGGLAEAIALEAGYAHTYIGAESEFVAMAEDAGVGAAGAAHTYGESENFSGSVLELDVAVGAQESEAAGAVGIAAVTDVSSYGESGTSAGGEVIVAAEDDDQNGSDNVYGMAETLTGGQVHAVGHAAGSEGSGIILETEGVAEADAGAVVVDAGTMAAVAGAESETLVGGVVEAVGDELTGSAIEAAALSETDVAASTHKGTVASVEAGSASDVVSDAGSYGSEWYDYEGYSTNAVGAAAVTGGVAESVDTPYVGVATSEADGITRAFGSAETDATGYDAGTESHVGLAGEVETLSFSAPAVAQAGSGTEGEAKFGLASANLGAGYDDASGDNTADFSATSGSASGAVPHSAGGASESAAVGALTNNIEGEYTEKVVLAGTAADTNALAASAYVPNSVSATATEGLIATEVGILAGGDDWWGTESDTFIGIGSASGSEAAANTGPGSAPTQSMSTTEGGATVQDLSQEAAVGAYSDLTTATSSMSIKGGAGTAHEALDWYSFPASAIGTGTSAASAVGGAALKAEGETGADWYGATLADVSGGSESGTLVDIDGMAGVESDWYGSEAEAAGAVGAAAFGDGYGTAAAGGDLSRTEILAGGDAGASGLHFSLADATGTPPPPFPSEQAISLGSAMSDAVAGSTILGGAYGTGYSETAGGAGGEVAILADSASLSSGLNNADVAIGASSGEAAGEAYGAIESKGDVTATGSASDVQALTTGVSGVNVDFGPEGVFEASSFQSGVDIGLINAAASLGESASAANIAAGVAGDSFSQISASEGFFSSAEAGGFSGGNGGTYAPLGIGMTESSTAGGTTTIQADLPGDDISNEGYDFTIKPMGSQALELGFSYGKGIGAAYGDGDAVAAAGPLAIGAGAFGSGIGVGGSLATSVDVDGFDTDVAFAGGAGLGFSFGVANSLTNSAFGSTGGFGAGVGQSLGDATFASGGSGTGGAQVYADGTNYNFAEAGVNVGAEGTSHAETFAGPYTQITAGYGGADGHGHAEAARSIYGVESEVGVGSGAEAGVTGVQWYGWD